MHAKHSRKSSRDSRVELLRIFAMVLIVICHFFAASVWNPRGLGSWRSALASLIIDNGQVGVVLFFAITGYFLVGRVGFNAKGFVRTWTQVFIYAIAFYVIALIADLTGHLPDDVQSLHGESGIHLVLKTFLPGLGNQFWFVSAYLILLLLSPFLNLVLKYSARTPMLLLIVCLAASSALPLLGFADTAPFTQIIYACTCYLAGGYIKMYSTSISTMTLPKMVTTVLLCMAVQFGAEWAVQVQLPVARWFNWGANTMSYVNFCMILSGTAILRYILHTSARKGTWNSRFVNTIASGMFGVYLIHENWLAHPIMYRFIGNMIPRPKSTFLVFALGVCLSLAIFVVCACLSLLIDAVAIHPIQKLAVPRIAAGINTLMLIANRHICGKEKEI